MLWLQGGPGGSSLFGLFAENGPFSVTENLELERRNTAWSLTHNVIYIDNPVGEAKKSLKIVFNKSVSQARGSASPMAGMQRTRQQ